MAQAVEHDANDDVAADRKCVVPTSGDDDAHVTGTGNRILSSVRDASLRTA